jgi:arylsulfatase
VQKNRWTGRAARALGGSLLLGLLLGACGRQEEAGGWNVLVILVDTLRADRLSLYGYPRPTSPRLDAFAREAVVFANARSQAACTFPSANSILTSRSPAVFLLQPGGTMAIPGTVRSLPEILRRQGYATAAVSASPIVRNTPSRINPTGGFGRGFQSFDESCWKKHADCVNKKTFGLIQTLPQPWFLYLHYLEPHAPYRPALNHRPRFAAPPDRARAQGVHRWARRGEAWPVARRLYDGNTQYDFTRRDIAHLSDLYDEEIAYLDEQLARLVDGLRERRLLDRTVIALVADHGEELYDHGDFGHCRNLAYENLLRTPFLLRIPGVEPGRRQALAENLDLVPTLLDYLGLAAEGLDGTSLRPVIEADRPVHRLSFAMQGVTRVVSDGKRKLTFDLATGRTRLFDLAADPGERSDLVARRPEEARRLQAALLRWMASHEGPAGESRRKAEELEKRLRALGYL